MPVASQPPMQEFEEAGTLRDASHSHHAMDALGRWKVKGQEQNTEEQEGTTVRATTGEAYMGPVRQLVVYALQCMDECEVFRE